MTHTLSAVPARLAVSGLLALGLSGGIVAAPAANAEPAPAPAPVSAPAAVNGPTGAVASRASVSSLGNRAVSVAASKRGAPYRWGATGPRAFDCSGFTSWTYKRIGKRIPRTAHQQYQYSRKINRSKARPGDLVFYGGSRKTHVGIYAGNGRMWHAPHTGDVVKLAKIRRGAAFGRVR